MTGILLASGRGPGGRWALPSHHNVGRHDAYSRGTVSAADDVRRRARNVGQRKTKMSLTYYYSNRVRRGRPSWVESYPEPIVGVVGTQFCRKFTGEDRGHQRRALLIANTGLHALSHGVRARRRRAFCALVSLKKTASGVRLVCYVEQILLLLRLFGVVTGSNRQADN